MEINIKIDNNEFLPQYQTSGAAGMDIRADFSKMRKTNEFKHFGQVSFNPKNQTMIISPNARVLIPTGIRVSIPEGYEIQFRSRSGTAFKKGLSMVNGVGTIDSDYRGEIGLLIINNSFQNEVVEHGERLGQIVLNKIEKIEWNEVEELDRSDRNEGGFGSTGTK